MFFLEKRRRCLIEDVSRTLKTQQEANPRWHTAIQSFFVFWASALREPRSGACTAKRLPYGDSVDDFAHFCQHPRET